ncbi:MAG TPA: metalloregulator ArsR/SmtB family transcription factor [Ktedonobacteraceae bacterium]|nr:metalloregulator ArsR/SmtB family transcription factor [Ktedonobacteraceae bacterium]
MPRKKTAAVRLNRAHSSILHRSSELDAFVDQFLSIVCDTSRRYILELLAAPNDNDPSVPTELRSGEIAQELGLSSATTSEHLRQLANLHMVTTRKQGTAVYYRLSNHLLVQAFLDLLRTLEQYYQKQLS